jgi:outer membrane protein OmpA-like peptidoglycan-associated protein
LSPSADTLAQALGIAFAIFLARAPECQGIGGHVAGDGRAGSNICTAPEDEGRHEGGVRADEGAGPDGGRVFYRATVVVAGDRARPDVRPGPHLRVAQVGEMVGLGALAEARLLELNEIADMGVLLDDGSWAQAREGSDARPRGDAGAVDVAERGDLHPCRDHRIAYDRRAFDACAAADAHLAAELHTNAELHVGGEAHVDADIARRGIAEGDAAALMVGDEATAQEGLRAGELGAGVDATHLVDLFDAHGESAPLGSGERDHIREVELALRVGRREAADRLPQERRRAIIDADVDLADGALGKRGVGVLDDPLDESAGADDTAIAGSVWHFRSEQGEGYPPAGPLQARQRRGLQEGHVAVEDEDTAGEALERLQAGASGIARAARLFLHGKDQGRSWKEGRERALHRVLILGIDDDDDRRAAPSQGDTHGMADERQFAAAVQHLGETRTHALALASGENQGGESAHEANGVAGQPCAVKEMRGAGSLLYIIWHLRLSWPTICLPPMHPSLALLLAVAPLGDGATADVSRFRPPPSGVELPATNTASVLQPLQYALSASFSYAHNPLVWRYQDGTYDPLIAHQLMLNLGAGIGVFKLFDVGLELPIALVHSGPEDNGLGISNSGASVSGAGIGDLRLVPRLALFPERSFGFAMAVVSEITLPTGRDKRFLGDPTLSWRPRLVATVPMTPAFLGRPVRVTGSLGYLLRKGAQVADLRLGNELELRAGVEAEVLRVPLPVSGLLDLGMATAASRPFAGNGLAAIEVLAGARVRVLEDFVLTAALGPGLTAGVGTPDVRFMLGVAWSPLPPDRDGDGIPDYVDACPDQPEDYDGFADLDGCPDPDNDGDGIPDTEDKCPNEPEDIDGVADDDGCPEYGVLDRDDDGIPDTEDQCPDQAEDIDGYQDEDGCPEGGAPDRDKDGIPDDKDLCPDEPEDIEGFQDEDGCPDQGEGLTEYIENVKIEIKATVLFESGKAIIKEVSKALLDEVAQQIIKHPQIKKVRIEGHTDSLGRAEDNLYLSQDRADSVRRYLINRGVPKDKLEAVGYGASRPIDTNDTIDGRTHNRRVEFMIVPQ